MFLKKQSKTRALAAHRPFSRVESLQPSASGALVWLCPVVRMLPQFHIVMLGWPVVSSTAHRAVI